MAIDPTIPSLILQQGQMAAQSAGMPLEVLSQALTGLEKTFKELNNRQEKADDAALKLLDMKSRLPNLDIQMDPVTGRPTVRLRSNEELAREKMGIEAIYRKSQEDRITEAIRMIGAPPGIPQGAAPLQPSPPGLQYPVGPIGGPTQVPGQQPEARTLPFITPDMAITAEQAIGMARLREMNVPLPQDVALGNLRLRGERAKVEAAERGVAEDAEAAPSRKKILEARVTQEEAAARRATSLADVSNMQALKAVGIESLIKSGTEKISSGKQDQLTNAEMQALGLKPASARPPTREELAKAYKAQGKIALIDEILARVQAGKGLIWDTDVNVQAIGKDAGIKSKNIDAGSTDDIKKLQLYRDTLSKTVDAYGAELTGLSEANRTIQAEQALEERFNNLQKQLQGLAE